MNPSIEILKINIRFMNEGLFQASKTTNELYFPLSKPSNQLELLNVYSWSAGTI